VLAFIEAWTVHCTPAGYLSGVYSSGASGITDLVGQYGTGYAEPDELWTPSWEFIATRHAADQPCRTPTCPAAIGRTTSNCFQYRGGHNEKYGGVTISVDNDYIVVRPPQLSELGHRWSRRSPPHRR